MTTDILEAPVAAAEENILAPVKALQLPDAVAANRTASNAVRMADSFVIATAEDFSMAADELASIKGKWNKLETQRTAITGPMNTALAAINNLFRGPMTMLKTAEATLKGSMLVYTEEQERIAAAAKKKRDEEAAVAQKLLDDAAREVENRAAAERQRIADEAAATARENAEKLEKLEQEAIAAGQSGDAAQMEAIEEQIGTLVESGDLSSRQAREEAAQIDESATIQAANLRAAASQTSSMVSTYSAPVKAAGVSKSTTYDYELLDMTKLVKHLAANPALCQLVTVDSAKMRAYVKSLGENANLPGVRVFSKSSISSRAR